MEHSKKLEQTKTPLTDAAQESARRLALGDADTWQAGWEHARKMEQTYNRERRRSKRLNRNIRRIHNEE